MELILIMNKTKTQKYIEAGLKLCPSGCLNEYQYQKHINGGVGTSNDETWIRTGRVKSGKNYRYTGYHKCCKSKRAYRHRVDCEYFDKINSDDLSDLD